MHCYQAHGALLPHPFTLTNSYLAIIIGGLLSAALVVGLTRPGVTWHPTLWSPDFPPPYNKYKAAIVWPTPTSIVRC